MVDYTNKSDRDALLDKMERLPGVAAVNEGFARNFALHEAMSFVRVLAKACDKLQEKADRWDKATGMAAIAGFPDQGARDTAERIAQMNNYVDRARAMLRPLRIRTDELEAERDEWKARAETHARDVEKFGERVRKLEKQHSNLEFELEILEQNRLGGNKYLLGRIEKMKQALQKISKTEWPTGYAITAANDMIATAMKALEEK